MSTTWIPLQEIVVSAPPSSSERRRQALVRGLRALQEALAIDLRLLYPTLLSLWWMAWEDHPAYETFYQPDAVGFAPAWGILAPQVMGTWQHEPGRGGQRESYVIGTPADVITSLAWGQRTYGGRFVGLRPVVPEAPVSRERIATWMFSYKGAGGAAAARTILRRLLPREVRPWIKRARWAACRPKYMLYPFKIDPRRPRHVPDKYATYRQRTKGEIWVDEVLPPAIRQRVSRYLDPLDFWRCATGQVHPEEVEPLILAHIRQVWVGGTTAVPRPTRHIRPTPPDWYAGLAENLDLF